MTLPRLRNKERGQTTVELVVVVPLLFLVFLMIVDFGWLFKNWIVVTNAAREATRCAAVARCVVDGNPVSPETFVAKVIEDGLGQNVLDDLEIDLDYLNVNGLSGIQAGDSVMICIRAENEFISPIMSVLTSSNTLPLSARNEMRLEQTPPGNPNPQNGECNY